MLRMKDPAEHAKLERRRDVEKVGKAMAYLRELANLMRELAIQIPPMEGGETYHRLITDLMAMFSQIRSRLMAAGV